MYEYSDLLFLLFFRADSGDGSFLFPVPVELFRGSILLGGLARLGLGEAAMHNSQVLVSPTLIAGWCGLVTSALNLLPAGRLDGGRMTQVMTREGERQKPVPEQP